MGSILLAVADAGSPTTGDAVIKSSIEAFGHTVTYISDETAEGSGYDGYCVAESCGGSTIGAKYTTKAAPLLCFEGAQADDIGLASTGATNSSNDSIDIIDDGNDCAGGLVAADNPHDMTTATGTLTSYLGGTLASALVNVAENASNNGPVVATLAAGETKQGGGTVEGLRVWLGFRDPTVAALTTDGQAVLDGCIEYAFGTAGGGGVTIPVIVNHLKNQGIM